MQRVESGNTTDGNSPFFAALRHGVFALNAPALMPGGLHQIIKQSPHARLTFPVFLQGPQLERKAAKPQGKGSETKRPPIARTCRIAKLELPCKYASGDSRHIQVCRDWRLNLCRMKISCYLTRSVLCWMILGTSLAVYGDALDSWATVPSGTTNRLWAVTFGGGLFVAAGDAGTVLTSSNGMAWNPVVLGITNSLRGAAYGQGQFVCVGASGFVMASTDGMSWSPQSSGTTNQLNAVASTTLGFVAAGKAGTIVTSSDGSNWVVQTSGTATPFVGLGSGFGRIYAGAQQGGPTLFWSSNGSVWFYETNTLWTFPFNGGFAVGNGVLLGVEIRGLFARSLDGDTWATSGIPYYYGFGLAFARDTFVTVGFNITSGGGNIGTSTAGTNWQTRFSQTSAARLLSVAYGKHRFIAVGDSGSIVASAPLLWLSEPLASPGGFQMTLNGDPGGVYHLQETPSVSTPSWSELGVVTNSSGVLYLVVSRAAGSPGAFYRAVAD
jgi:hypothetical protein